MPEGQIKGNKYKEIQIHPLQQPWLENMKYYNNGMRMRSPHY